MSFLPDPDEITDARADLRAALLIDDRETVERVALWALDVCDETVPLAFKGEKARLALRMLRKVLDE